MGDPDLGGGVDPLTDPHGRDFAVRDYRTFLKTMRRAKPATINAHLTALDHFYGSHLGLGRPVAKRERVPVTAPQALEEFEQRKFLRAAQKCGSVRDTAIALPLLYTGLRVEEVQQLDLADVPISARRGKVIVRAGKGEHGRLRRPQKRKDHSGERNKLGKASYECGWPGWSVPAGWVEGGAPAPISIVDSGFVRRC